MKCKTITYQDGMLHILRNPHGFPEEVVREARCAAGDRIEALEAYAEQLTEALRTIINPIPAMQAAADKAGAKLDGARAVQLAEEPSYLRQVARFALAKNPNPAQAQPDGAASGASCGTQERQGCDHDWSEPTHLDIARAKSEEKPLPMPQCVKCGTTLYADLIGGTAPPEAAIAASIKASLNPPDVSFAQQLPVDPSPAAQQAGVRELRNAYWTGTDYARVCAIYRAMVEASHATSVATERGKA